MKQTLKSFCLMLLVLLCFNYVQAYAEAAAPPEINAEGSALIDVSTGEILFDKNCEKQFEPASTTKVMTALVVLDQCDLNEEVTVTADFTSIDGTAIGLLNGDVLTVRDLLLGLLLESGNDCANALAIHVSGSIEAFSALMNEKAKDLGATNTNFKNPSGLPDPEHLTTPHDLALIMGAAIKNKDFMEISTTGMYSITLKNDSSRTITANNKNYLINKNSKHYYPYAISGKNGYTTKANHTYVAAAEKDGHTLVAAFLNAVDKNKNFDDMKTVFDYGFNNFELVTLYKQGEEIAQYDINDKLTIPLTATEDINYLAPIGDSSSVTPELKIINDDLSKKSFITGENILKGIVYVNGHEFKTINLASGVTREYIPPIKNFVTKSPYTIPSVFAGCIMGIALIIFVNSRKSRKKPRFKHLKR